MLSRPARYVRPSDNAVQPVQARETVKAGLNARPALIAECATSSRPRCASGGQPKKCWRIIAVGLDRPSKPSDSLLPNTEVELCQARGEHPDVGHRVARAEP